MIKKIIFGLILVFGLSVQSQSKKAQPSYETKVKNYVMWFESLPDHKKREEANVLVMRLNMMSAYDRGMWLATSAKYSKQKETPEVKEILIDSLTNVGVKKKLFADIIKEVGEKVDSIVILSSSIAKDRTVASNTEIRKKIAEWKLVISETERKLDSILGKPRNHDHYMANSRIVDDLVDKSEEGHRALISLRNDIITYNGESVDDINKWNSYLIDEYEVEVLTSVPHQLTNEELDSGNTSGIKFDKKILRYFAKFERGYTNGIRRDEDSSFELERIDGDDD